MHSTVANLPVSGSLVKKAVGSDSQGTTKTGGCHSPSAKRHSYKVGLSGSWFLNSWVFMGVSSVRSAPNGFLLNVVVNDVAIQTGLRPLRSYNEGIHMTSPYLTILL